MPLRAHVSLVDIVGWIGDANFQERIVPLAALAAGPAVQKRRASGFAEFSRFSLYSRGANLVNLANLASPENLDRAHARQRQLEWDTERQPAPNHLRFADLGIRCLDAKRVSQAERQCFGHCRAKCRRGVGKRIMRKRAQHQPLEFRGGAVYAGFAEQHDVATRKIDVFVRRVVAGRATLDSPTGCRVHVAHVDRQRYEGAHVRTKSGARQKRGNHGAFRRLPGESDAHIDWLDATAGGLFCQKDRAIQAAREENSRWHPD